MKILLTIISALLLNTLIAQDTLLVMTITPLEGYESEAEDVALNAGFTSCGDHYCIEILWKQDNADHQHVAASSGFFSNIVSQAPEEPGMPTTISEADQSFTSIIIDPYTGATIDIVRGEYKPDRKGFFVVKEIRPNQNVVTRKVVHP